MSYIAAKKLSYSDLYSEVCNYIFFSLTFLSIKLHQYARKLHLIHIWTYDPYESQGKIRWLWCILSILLSMSISCSGTEVLLLNMNITLNSLSADLEQKFICLPWTLVHDKSGWFADVWFVMSHFYSFHLVLVWNASFWFLADLVSNMQLMQLGFVISLYGYTTFESIVFNACVIFFRQMYLRSMSIYRYFVKIISILHLPAIFVFSH